MEEVEKQFNKRFKFSKPQDGWNLPSAEQLWTGTKWSDEKLTSMKKDLNAVKSKLNDKARGPWREHTLFTNPAGGIIYNLKRRFKPQLCTQAWAKGYEILSNYYEPKTPPGASLQTVHLCEAPGAFITALNHFLALRYPQLRKKWDWIATTLNPYYEGNSQMYMIADDRFIMHTIQNWEFGEDNTGNIMNYSNILQLERRARHVSLVTADGSINCSLDPSEQEGLVSFLHSCEVITALSLLRAGGSFVIKMFTFYESSAINLLYLLNCAFANVYVFKPGTSKEGNSEVYVVCLCYRKHYMTPYLPELRKIFDVPKHDKLLLCKEHIPEEFIKQVYNCSEYFKEIQVFVINKNLRLYGNMTEEDKRQCKEFQSDCFNYYKNKFHVNKINENNLIVPLNMMKPLSQDSFPKDMLVTYDDLTERQEMDIEQRRERMEKALIDLMDEKWDPNKLVKSDISYNEIVGTNLLLEAEFIIEGKLFDAVKSSRFSYQYLLNSWNEINEFIESSPAKLDCFTSDVEEIVSKCFPSNGNQFTVLDLSACSAITNGTRLHYKLINLHEFVLLTNKVNHFLEEKLLWIEALLYIAHNISKNGDVVCLVDRTDTRFVVGCIYILAHCFEQLKLIRPKLVPAIDHVTILACSTYREINEENIHFLKTVQNGLKAHANEVSILEIVPVPRLINDENFYQFLYNFNKYKLAQQLHFLLQQMRKKETKT